MIDIENSHKAVDTMRKVQYGCGLSAPQQWVNYDSSLTLKLQKIPLLGRFVPDGPFGRFPSNIEVGDIVKGLSEKEDSVDICYCSHVLEHLTLEEFRIALKNTYKMLKPGGTFRFVLPDMETKVKRYIESYNAEAIHNLMEDTYLGKKNRDTTLKGKLRDLFRNDQHLWMWDFKSMNAELIKVGFVNIRRAHFGDSSIKDFSEVEEFSRWENELGVECRK